VCGASGCGCGEVLMEWLKIDDPLRGGLFVLWVG